MFDHVIKDNHMIPNIKQAKENFVDHGFAPYSSVYIVTNEDLRNTLICMQKDTNRALTVAASGDHPMFTQLYGAKYVDTFDISFNARLIMDIKTHALSLLNHEEYCTLLTHLYLAKDITRVKHMPQIIEKLTPFEQRYIKELCGTNLFDKRLDCIPKSFPTETEFQKMQQVIKKPFNFIFSDIQTLHKKLRRDYDFMHLSNIFDYLKTYQNCVNVLGLLAQHTNPGCNICFTCFIKDAEAICEKFIWEQSLSSDKKQFWTANNVPGLNRTFVMHRTR
jgi:hypothetical protein